MKQGFTCSTLTMLTLRAYHCIAQCYNYSSLHNYSYDHAVVPLRGTGPQAQACVGGAFISGERREPGDRAFHDGSQFMCM